MTMLLSFACGGCEAMNFEKTRRTNYIRDHSSELSERDIRCIQQGIIYIGMPSSHVVASWGKPDRINNTITAYGRSAQWVYGYTFSYKKQTYVYFEDEKVTAIQD